MAKAGTLRKVTLRTLPPRHFGIHRDQARGRIELQMRHRLDGGHHAGFDQHGHHADGVGAGHGRILHLLHDHETGVGFRMGGRQDQVAVERRIAARLAQHAQADVVGVRFQPGLLFEHGVAGNVQHAAGDDAAGFAAGVRVHRRNHAAESHHRTPGRVACASLSPWRPRHQLFDIGNFDGHEGGQDFRIRCR